MTVPITTTTPAPTVALSGTGLPDPQGPDAVHVPRIGLGTWPLVGTEARAAVVQALQLGYRHVDTAEMYGNEDAVGAGVRESGLARAEIFVTSKLTNATFGDTATVRAGLEATLERMGLDYLDLYLIHWPNPHRAESEGTFRQTSQALAELTGSGLLRAWGVSNFTPHHLRTLRDDGLVPAVNQVQVDPYVAQPHVLAANRNAGVLTVAYSPLGRGGELFDLPEVTGPAERLGITPAQALLRWHVQSGRVAVPKSADAGRQRSNLDVFGFELTEAEMQALDSLDTGAGPRLDPDEHGR
ncbi:MULTISPECIES: aldo/keto reductase [Micrococcaceae]|uniref:aldo/keto reductase n=1 Tax=Micrococcaceae TaxID=1268 RepID=UPI00160C0AD1|nr:MULTISPECIES: aldo/keto reductase [Micrococcaceae]MBB5750100.1 2,5-diketo-D-gluconate reductase A [Micrococcus sp. TA1]HRO95030.1 aldo/keto reductase [Citricoccus sp.]